MAPTAPTKYARLLHGSYTAPTATSLINFRLGSRLMYIMICTWLCSQGHFLGLRRDVTDWFYVGDGTVFQSQSLARASCIVNASSDALTLKHHGGMVLKASIRYTQACRSVVEKTTWRTALWELLHTCALVGPGQILITDFFQKRFPPVAPNCNVVAMFFCSTQKPLQINIEIGGVGVRFKHGGVCI